jgi:Fe-S-cluster-containing dehydrogenase component/formate-dependent nitrite reductase membrane component NrfD
VVVRITNFGFVIDNRRCIGCHACTVACKTEHDDPIGVNKTWVKYIEKGSFPDTSRNFSVMRCNHCADSPCTDVCPVTALWEREDGIVDFDPERCIGCKACMQGCPYDALYIDPNTDTAAKCNYCSHRVDTGREPACVTVCPEDAIIAGDLENPATDIARTVADQEVQARKVEKGTEPNLFYVDGDEGSVTPGTTAREEHYMWSDAPTRMETRGAAREEFDLRKAAESLARSDVALPGDDATDDAGEARADGGAHPGGGMPGVPAVGRDRHTEGGGGGDDHDCACGGDCGCGRGSDAPAGAESAPAGAERAADASAAEAAGERDREPTIHDWDGDDDWVNATREDGEGPSGPASDGGYDTAPGGQSTRDRDVRSRTERAYELLQEEARRVYDVGENHYESWGWEVYAYTWTKSISAGIVLVPALLLLAGVVPADATLVGVASVVSLAFLGLTTALLVADLEQPRRFHWVLLRPNWTSWLVKGGYVLTLTGGFLTAVALGWLLGFEAAVTHPATLLVAAALTTATAVYTAFLLGQSKGRDLWQSPALPLHMFVQAVVAGAATAALLGLVGVAGFDALVGPSRAVLAGGLVVHAALVGSELFTAHQTEDAEEAARRITRGRFRTAFWGGMAVGVGLPLVVLAGSGAAAAVAGASVLALAGLFAYEYCWIIAPQTISLA